MDPVTGSVQKQIVNALHLGERERASTLLSHIGYNKHMLNANHFIHILEYCAFTPDPLVSLIMKLFYCIVVNISIPAMRMFSSLFTVRLHTDDK